MLDAMVLVCEDSTSHQGGDLDAAELAWYTGCISSLWVVCLTEKVLPIFAMTRAQFLAWIDLKMTCRRSYRHHISISLKFKYLYLYNVSQTCSE